MHGSASLQPLLVVWIYVKILGIICYMWVLNEGDNNYFKNWCLSHKFKVYLSAFLILTYFWLNEMVILSKGQKDINRITMNHTPLSNLALPIFKALVRILLNVNLLLNQTFRTFLLYVRKTWMTQLILTISLWGVIFL